jgi:hypothetical protein
MAIDLTKAYEQQAKRPMDILCRVQERIDPVSGHPFRIFSGVRANGSVAARPEHDGWFMSHIDKMYTDNVEAALARCRIILSGEEPEKDDEAAADDPSAMQWDDYVWCHALCAGYTLVQVPDALTGKRRSYSRWLCVATLDGKAV